MKSDERLPKKRFSIQKAFESGNKHVVWQKKHERFNESIAIVLRCFDKMFIEVEF